MGSGFSYDMRENGEANLVTACALTFTHESTLVVFDVGAHRAEWIEFVLAARRTAVEAHLFEPTAELADDLRERFSEREYVLVNEAALSDIEGELLLKSFGARDSVNSLVISSVIHDGRLGESALVPVQGLTGDFYCAKNSIHRIDVLKVDVEGAELRVLKGFDAMISAQKIGVIQFEYGFANGDAGDLMRDFYTFFSDRGYEVGVLRQDGVHFSKFTYEFNNFESGPNYVAVLPRFVTALAHFATS